MRPPRGKENCALEGLVMSLLSHSPPNEACELCGPTEPRPPNVERANICELLSKERLSWKRSLLLVLGRLGSREKLYPGEPEPIVRLGGTS